MKNSEVTPILSVLNKISLPKIKDPSARVALFRDYLALSDIDKGLREKADQIVKTAFSGKEADLASLQKMRATYTRSSAAERESIQKDILERFPELLEIERNADAVYESYLQEECEAKMETIAPSLFLEIISEQGCNITCEELNLLKPIYG